MNGGSLLSGLGELLAGVCAGGLLPSEGTEVLPFVFCSLAGYEGKIGIPICGILWRFWVSGIGHFVPAERDG